MKDEIKEIERILATSGKYITYAERCYLLDYITNLQEENTQTKLLKERYQLEKEVYKLRNEKAIEILKNTMYPDIAKTKALNILQGEDKDE